MQNFKTLRQSLLGELAMSPERRREREREKNAIYSGHLRLCQQPRAAHALRSDQFFIDSQFCHFKTILSFLTYSILSYLSFLTHVFSCMLDKCLGVIQPLFGKT